MKKSVIFSLLVCTFPFPTNNSAVADDFKKLENRWKKDDSESRKKGKGDIKKNSNDEKKSMRSILNS